MSGLVIPITDPGALDPTRVGPKAANLAALSRTGMPTPGGFCITAEAYRLQLREIDLQQTDRCFADADVMTQRRLSVQMRLGLYEQPISPQILEPAIEAWRAQRAASSQPGNISTGEGNSLLTQSTSRS